MQNVKKTNEPLVFGLDIGTRSIVGTVGYYKAQQFHVIALRSIEHTERVMLDGQIHDIAGVATEIREVKKMLEDDIGQPLTEVCIAAAGRVLRTVTTHVEQDLGEDQDITEEQVYALEMQGAQKAYEEFIRDNDLRIHFFCVGYTVERYYLNRYQMGSLSNHKGHLIGADLITTFLPDEVVDGLYKAVEMADLKVANLTLEPIAAMEVAIPKSYRMLNIALVDVGAGTSDICITRDEAIVAYGMIPSAGDELTEAIAKECLTDFATAEEIKRSAKQKAGIKYKDIMGIDQKIDPAEVQRIMDPVIEIMTHEISEQIKKLNGDRPVSAIFVVGGGGKATGFTKCLAKEQGIQESRVAIRGEEVLKDVDFQVKNIDVDSLLVTPVGICLNFYSSKNNFVFISFNGKQIKLYDNSTLRISDAAMQAEFPNEDLFPKRGPEISFTINGRKQVRRGEVGEAAEIILNGKNVSIGEKIKSGDNIVVKPSTVGSPAVVPLGKLPEFSDNITVMVNGKPVSFPKCAAVNGELKSAYYEIKDGDDIEMLRYYTVQQIIDFMDVTPVKGKDILVNHEIALPETQVYDNFSLEWTVEEDNPPVDMEAVKKEAEEKQKALEEQLRKEAEEKARLEEEAAKAEEAQRAEEERKQEEMRKRQEVIDLAERAAEASMGISADHPEVSETPDSFEYQPSPVNLEQYEKTDISEEKRQGNISETLPDIAAELSPRKEEPDVPEAPKEVDFTGMQSEYGAKKILDHIAQISNETHTITNVRGFQTTTTSVPKNAIEKSVAEAAKKTTPVNRSIGIGAPVPEEKPVEEPKEPVTMEVIANGQLIRMTGKPVYMYVDIFDFIDFDLKTPHGSSVATEINGRKAQFTEPLHDGDVISIYWRE